MSWIKLLRTDREYLSAFRNVLLIQILTHRNNDCTWIIRILLMFPLSTYLYCNATLHQAVLTRPSVNVGPGRIGNKLASFVNVQWRRLLKTTGLDRGPSPRMTLDPYYVGNVRGTSTISYYLLILSCSLLGFQINGEM